MAEQDWVTIFQEKTMDLEDWWDLEFDDSIMPYYPRRYWKQYITSSSASFGCSMCGRSWPSNKVTVVFHMRLMLYGQGFVKVRCFRQSCKMCVGAPMVEPEFSEMNIDTVLENLVKKIRIKCYKEYLGKYESPYFRTPVKSPHEPYHCEACQQGICTRN